MTDQIVLLGSRGEITARVANATEEVCLYGTHWVRVGRVRRVEPRGDRLPVMVELWAYEPVTAAHAHPPRIAHYRPA